MASEYELKIADESDFDAIIEIGDDLFDFKVRPNRLSEFLNDERHYLALAYCKGKVVGMASGLAYVHPDKDLTLFVNEVGVIDELQGKGIGSNLVEFLCDYAKTRGCVEAWVATESSNIAAIKAFIKAGGEKSAEPISLITYKLSAKIQTG